MDAFQGGFWRHAGGKPAHRQSQAGKSKNRRRHQYLDRERQQASEHCDARNQKSDVLATEGGVSRCVPSAWGRNFQEGRARMSGCSCAPELVMLERGSWQRQSEGAAVVR